MKKTNQLNKTKVKNSKLWATYQEKKSKILNSPRISSTNRVKKIKKLYSDTQNKISSNWNYYEIKKYNKSKKDLKIISEQNINDGKIVNYNLKELSSNKFEKNLKSILRKRNIRYILIVLRIKVNDSEQILTISDSFTDNSIRNLIESGENIYNLVIEKLMFNKSQENRELKYDLSGGFEILSITYKVIYENSTKSKKTKKH